MYDARDSSRLLRRPAHRLDLQCRCWYGTDMQCSMYMSRTVAGLCRTATALATSATTRKQVTPLTENESADLRSVATWQAETTEKGPRAKGPGVVFVLPFDRFGFRAPYIPVVQD